MYTKLFLIIILLCFIHLHCTHKEVIYYDWNSLNLNTLVFPDNFNWGVATSSYQIEGFNNYNQWYDWELKTGIINGESILHRIKYKEDIDLMKSLGVNSYRLSLEWSRIEKTKGVIDYKELEYYNDLINYCLKNNIELMITLFHWTLPKWFTDIGGFEKHENCKYFINYSKLIYKIFYKKVKKWCITNEVMNYCNASYNVGLFPPCKTDTKLCLQVYWNILDTQVNLYYELKKIYSETEIGFAKQFSIFRPYNKYSIIDNFLSSKIDELFNLVEINFYKTGVFKAKFGLITLEEYNFMACDSFDFIGVNYYSHNYVNFNLFSKDKVNLVMHPNETPTDFLHTIYPEGLVDIIKDVSQLNKKIYITENGIADKEDKNRGMYIKKVLYLLSNLIKEGYNIAGYYHWTLIDNFEWNEGFEPKFGLFAVDENKNRIIRNSALIYRDIINKVKS